jgi:hypothetical protein
LRVRRLFSALLLLCGGTSVVLADSVCPPQSPVLTGPPTVQAGDAYSISWTNVLGNRNTPDDSYVIERSPDPNFVLSVDRTATTRSAATLLPGPTGVSTLYHRIVVHSSCPAPTASPVVSNTLDVAIRTDCPVPAPAGDITVSPPNPPAYSTYVVSWDTGGNGGPGPGGGPVNLKFRLRRTSPLDTKESVSDSGSASFSDAPGEYVYQVRAEASCGATGPWSLPTKVVVGNAPPASLLLVGEPKPIIIVASAAPGFTSFVVRNGGNTALAVTATPDQDYVHVQPSTFTINPNETQALTAAVLFYAPTFQPYHTAVTLSAGPTTLKVPVDVMITAAPAPAPVVWSDGGADIDANGDAVLRTITNPAATRAGIIASNRVPWITVQSLDGQPWDRPLAPRETRTVRIVVDRARRRSAFGTEIGVVTIFTAGQSDVSTLTVTDDGPKLPYYGVAGVPVPTNAKTRLLYASMPNAADALGVGRFTGDLWMTNSDVVSPIDVTMCFTPIEPGGARAYGILRVDQTLGPGETRRFRNVVGNLLGVEGAYSVDVRSSAATLSATAIVNNTPLQGAAASRGTMAGSRNALDAPANNVNLAAVKNYGFEMRPTAPGEGVKATDPLFVLSGMIHSDKKRTNVLLLETSGYDTYVDVSFFQGKNGTPVTKNGANVVLNRQLVNAGQTVQINDADIFDGVDPLLDPFVWALVKFDDAFIDAFGISHGSVVPMATIVDNRTSDSALHVGVSAKDLNPVIQNTQPASARGAVGRNPLAGLPYAGGPMPLLMPIVHGWGAPLARGAKPFWRSRIALTNSSEEQRQVQFQVLDQTGNVAANNIFPNVYVLGPGTTVHFDDFFEEACGVFVGGTSFPVPPDLPMYGGLLINPPTALNKRSDGSYASDWSGVDVQTEIYTVDPNTGDQINAGEYASGMEAYTYLHGYSSFQSNLGMVQFDGAENSSQYRTNLILHEVGNATSTVSITAYLPGSFIPIAGKTVSLAPLEYKQAELFNGFLGLDLSEITDVRVVVRQIDGDGVFMAFASKINLATGDPANIFLRPAAAGTGR